MSNSRSAGTVFEGNLDAKGLKFGIVCARFNDFFVSRLLDGAMDAIVRHPFTSDGASSPNAPAFFPSICTSAARPFRNRPSSTGTKR